MQDTVKGKRRPREAAPRPTLFMRVQFVVGLAVSIGILAVGAVVLLDARNDAMQQAERASTNLAMTIERDIARNIAVFDLSLQGAIEALREPGIENVRPEIRQAAVFDRAASAEFLGSILVLDKEGNITVDSTSIKPHRVNLADRDYFSMQRDHSDLGLYVSRPFISRLRVGDASIAISRRLSGPDGSFQGVVVGALRLAYFRDLFAKLDLGVQGAVGLIRADGRVIARYPLREGDVDRDISDSASYRSFTSARAGQFIGSSPVDKVERLFTFRRVGNLPLILSVAVSLDDIYATWWHKSTIVGSLIVTLTVANMALCLLFHRELTRRLAAEKALRHAADRLSVMAATDGLTGLANRRTFETRLADEWRRAHRGNNLIALLMLDADCFKLFNDTYGHQQGDRVLQSIAECMRTSIMRPGDLGARYGGEEFAVLLPETDFAGAVTIAERIREAVENLDIVHAGGPCGRVTVSIGVAVTRPLQQDAAGLFVNEADAALYEAKRSGRNRVCVAGRENATLGAG